MNEQEGAGPRQTVEQPGPMAPGSGVPVQPVQDAAGQIALYRMQRAIRSGGGWFYWIAGMSIINTLMAMFHGKFSFVIGLGVTQVVDVIIRDFKAAAFIGLPINVMIAGVYVLFGYFACRRARWAFITGMVLYALDGLLLLAFQQYIAVAFHAWALFCVSVGLTAIGKTETLERQVQQTPGR